MKLKRLSFFLCFILAGPVYALRVTNLDVRYSMTHWTLSFDTDSRPKIKLFSLKNPHRVVIDFYNVTKRPKLSLWKLKELTTPILNLRTSWSPQQVFRVVLDLKSAQNVHATTSSSGVRVDLSKSKHTTQSSQVKVTAHRGSESVKKTGSAASTLKNFMVVIDPGHGGKDPGATGRKNIHEKNIVLKISKLIAAQINAQPGFVSRLTRNGDYYLTLRQRLALARKYKANMFVAIHADAYKYSSAHGVSVFALSLKGATSEAARWVADKENQSELLGGASLENKSTPLKSFLINLSQNLTVQTSVGVGSSIIEQVRPIAVLHQKKVEQAAFVVLKSPDIPSLLIETGFVSNAREERLLVSSWYQRKIAHAIARGITSYFIQHPPKGTYLYVWKDNPSKIKFHTVRSGDTLSEIAQRYGTAVSRIKRLNHLRSSRIMVGQRLKIY